MTKFLAITVLAALSFHSVSKAEYLTTNENYLENHLKHIANAKELKEFADFVGVDNKVEKGSIRFVLKSELNGQESQKIPLGRVSVDGKLIDCEAHMAKDEVFSEGIHTLKMNPAKMGSGKAAVLKFSTDDKDYKSRVVCTAVQDEETQKSKPASSLAISQSDLESYFTEPVYGYKDIILNSTTSESAHLILNSKRLPDLKLWETTESERTFYDKALKQPNKHPSMEYYFKRANR